MNITEVFTEEEIGQLATAVENVKAVHIQDDLAFTQMREYAYASYGKRPRREDRHYLRKLVDAVRHVKVVDIPANAMPAFAKWQEFLIATKGAA